MSSVIENFLAADTAPVGLLVVPEALGLAGFLELVDEVLGWLSTLDLVEAFLVNDLTVTLLLVLGVAESDLLRILRRRLKADIFVFHSHHVV